MSLSKHYSLYLQKNLKKALFKIILQNNELILYIKHSFILNITNFLKFHSLCQYKILLDICGVDYLNKKNRFEVVYNFLSVYYNSRIRVKVQTNELSPIFSINSIFLSSNWFEREVWDMYGIFFTGNLDLRRILTDYGFEGFPLRKDFPLNGFVEVRYDESKKKVICEPLEFTQEIRLYNFLTPWNPDFLVSSNKYKYF